MRSTMLTTWRDRFSYVGHRMLQKKKISHQDTKTELRRCFSTIQLTFLGIGSTIGVGIYVLLGVIAKDIAGPAVTISFLLAIFVTLVNALVYSEFASAVPQTGAAYTFLYKSFGEFPAFLCGWIMFISYLLSSSIGARAWSGMLDSFFNNSIQAFTTSHLGYVQFGLPFAKSLDLVAFFFQVTVTIIVSCNIHCSSVINTALGVLTTSVLVFVFVAGVVFGDVDNFLNADHGGFLPFGIGGVVKGASIAIYATTGFDIICMSAEEAKDPVKSVPRAIILELTFVAFVYIGAAVGMLFLIPYGLLDLRSPLSSAFEYGGLVWGKYIVIIGPLFGITNLQMLGLYGCSRLVYRMACDGLSFSFFLKVNRRTGIPLNSVVVTGLLMSVFSMLFELSYLVEVTVLLMLINGLALGSALISLKMSESEEFFVLKASTSSARNKTGCGDNGDSVGIEMHERGGSQEKRECSDARLLPSDSPADDEIASHTNLTSFGSHLHDDQNFDNANDQNFDNANDQNSVNANATSSLLEIQSDFSHNINAQGRGVHHNDSEDNNNDEDENNAEEDVLFQISPQKSIANGKESESPLKGSKIATSEVLSNSSIRAKLAAKISFFVPETLSIRAVMVLHFVCCMMVSYQINYSRNDILSAKPAALVAICLTLLPLAVCMFLLWLHNTKRASVGFQTPLLPVIPTLCILCNGVLLFSVITRTGIIELVVITALSFVVYLVMVVRDMKNSPHAEEFEQMRALVEDQDSDEDF